MLVNIFLQLRSMLGSCLPKEDISGFLAPLKYLLCSFNFTTKCLLNIFYTHCLQCLTLTLSLFNPLKSLFIMELLLVNYKDLLLTQINSMFSSSFFSDSSTIFTMLMTQPSQNPFLTISCFSPFSMIYLAIFIISVHI